MVEELNHLTILFFLCYRQVNNNGVISFLVEVSQYTPDTFPLGGNRRLVAPFWADVDTGNGGDVFYRETTDPNLLQQATDDVKAAYVDQRKFKATWLLIATWYEVAFYGASGGYTNRVRNSDLSPNTKQSSFCIFTFSYDCFGLHTIETYRTAGSLVH